MWIIGLLDVMSVTKKAVKKPKAPLGSMRTGAPMECLGIDILWPFPTTERLNRYILTATCHFTKWVEIFPIQNESAESCAKVLVNEVISRYGCPIEIHTDQGRNFQSKVFKTICNMLTIRKTRSSPKNPKCNGQIERFHSTLTAMIRAYIKDQTDWDLNLGCLAGAYRSTPPWVNFINS